MASKVANPLFDYALYGLLVRKGRLDMGFKKAEEFSDAVWRRTHVMITKDMLYKIEQGRQVPDTTQFLALNLVLSGTPFNEAISSMCFSVECRQIIEAHSIPDEWKAENTNRVWLDETGAGTAKEAPQEMPRETWTKMLSSTAQNMSHDDKALFDPEVDSEWHDSFEAALIETFGPDTEEWPVPDKE